MYIFKNCFIFAFVDDGHIYEEEGVDMTDSSYVCIITFNLFHYIEICNPWVILFANKLL